jgi:hypothetical protein
MPRRVTTTIRTIDLRGDLTPREVHLRRAQDAADGLISAVCYRVVDAEALTVLNRLRNP